jgi:hypothetical protein
MRLTAGLMAITIWSQGILSGEREAGFILPLREKKTGKQFCFRPVVRGHPYDISQDFILNLRAVGA